MNISRQDNFFLRNFSARFQCITGLILLCIFLLSQGWQTRAVLALIFGILAWLVGKRIRITYFILFITASVFFHLLVPVGRVIFEIGGISITQIALELGLEKGATLCGMVFGSLFTIRRDLQIRGRFGALLMRTLYYFELLFEYRKQLRIRHLAEDIDAILLNVYSNQDDDVKSSSCTITTLPAWAINIVLITLFLCILIWSRFR